MAQTEIPLGQSVKPEVLHLKLANRHGLITGATGTGKTVTLQTLAEGFSAAGVPVFAADIKGDLSGLAMAGTEAGFITERLSQMGVTDWKPHATPVIFWDIFGEQGHPIRTTITEMGPLMLSRLLGLSEAQEGALNIAFRIADEEGLALLDLKDLRAMLSELAERGREIRTDYGNVTAVTLGSIQRALMVLEQQGAVNFFGEPALDIGEFLRTTRDGRGIVNLLAADRLMQSPQLYATFLLWLLSELFETLPEAGDTDRPRLVFFFDEAHLLFDEAPKGLIDKVEQVVKLVRSKGVGVYFVTQNPLDIPDSVLSRLGNRVQHALRAYTPRDQKAVKVAAETFRANPAFDTEKVITELGKGEALVSVLDMKGACPRRSSARSSARPRAASGLSARRNARSSSAKALWPVSMIARWTGSQRPKSSPPAPRRKPRRRKPGPRPPANPRNRRARRPRSPNPSPPARAAPLPPPSGARWAPPSCAGCWAGYCVDSTLPRPVFIV